MIIFEADSRLDVSIQNAVNIELNLLSGSVAVQAMLLDKHDKVVYTTQTPDGDELPKYDTGVGTLVDVYNYTGLNYEPIDQFRTAGQVLLIESAFVGGTQSVAEYGSSIKGDMSFTRVLFHELAHLAFSWETDVGLVNFEEELAVFAENTIYRHMALSLGKNDTFIRFGHYGTPWNGRGSSGVSAIEMYIQAPSAVLGFDKTVSDAHTAVFHASLGGYRLTKVYHNNSHEVDGFLYDHYIRLTETSQSSYIEGISINSSGFSFSRDGRLNALLSDMMHRDVDGALTTAVGAAVATGMTSSMFFERVTGLGADAWVDRNHSDGEEVYAGVADAGTTNTPNAISIDDHDAISATLMVGPAGWSGGLHGEVLRAGSGNDVLLASGLGGNDLFGNEGNDVIVGTAGFDNILGGVGDDLLIGNGGNDFFDGGDNVDTLYYGNRSTPITVHGNLGQVGYTGGLDTYVNVERIFGTAGDDTFVGGGAGMMFHGNGGTDKFIAGPGPDTFIGSGTVTFATLGTGVDVDVGSGTTTIGHTFGYPTEIYGSFHNDIFHSVGVTNGGMVRGDDGDDQFEIGGYFRVFGENGNDTFYLEYGVAPDSVIDGGAGTGDTIDASRYGLSSRVGFDWSTADHKLQTNGQWIDLPGVERFVLSPGDNLVYLTNSVRHNFTGGQGADEIHGGAMTDYLYGGGSRATVQNGPSSSNALYGEGGNDFLYAQPGAQATVGDYLYGGGGNDELNGSGLADHLFGGADNDRMIGNAGNDHFYDSQGTNTMFGGAGYDTMHLDGFDRSSLTFGTTAGYRYVTDGVTFFNYFDTTMEAIMTANGAYNGLGIHL